MGVGFATNAESSRRRPIGWNYLRVGGLPLAVSPNPMDALATAPPMEKFSQPTYSLPSLRDMS